MIKWSIIICGLCLIICCREVKKTDFPVTYSCNLEVPTTQSGRSGFGEGDHFFKQGGVMVHDAELRQNAMQVSAETPYALTINLDEVDAKDYFEVRVHRKTPGNTGVLVAKIPDVLASHVSLPSGRTDDGWYILRKAFHIPPHYDQDEPLTIFVMNQDSAPVIFKDLEIIHYKNKVYPKYEDAYLDIQVTDQYMHKSDSLIKACYPTKVLHKKAKKNTPANLVYQDQKTSGKVRLKGDWLDHVQSDKWSFRVTTDEPINGMSTFSVQGPMTKGGLYSWLFHKLLKREDVLTTAIDFIPVKINGENRGIYNQEEHFGTWLTDRYSRPASVILKFDETPFWSKIQASNKGETIGAQNYFAASDIKPFHKKAVLKDSALTTYFLRGRGKMNQLRKQEIPVGEVFDLPAFAKAMALVDLFKAHHGFVWHNLRFYYNPESDRVEPVLYDGFTNHPFHNDDIELSIKAAMNGMKSDRPEYFFLLQVFSDSTFVSDYLTELDRVSNPDFITSFLTEFENETKLHEKDIRREYPGFEFDVEHIRLMANLIQKELPKITSGARNCRLENVPKNEGPYHPAIGLQVFRNGDELQVINHSSHEVTMIGNGSKKKMTPFEEEITVQPGEINAYLITAKSITYKVSGKTYTTKVIPWPI